MDKRSKKIVQQDSYSINEKSKEDKNKIDFSTFFFGMFILFAFACNNVFFGITEYWYFPVFSMMLNVLYFIKNNKVVIRVEHFCCYILLGVFLVQLYRNVFDRGLHFSYILLVLMFLSTTLKRVNKGEVRFLINCYIISALILSLMIIVFRQEFNDWVGTYRYTIKSLNGVFIDPNFLAAFINIPAIFCVNRMLVTGQKRYLPLIVIIVLATLLTGSRAALLAFCIGSAIVMSCHSNKFFWAVLVLPVLGIIILKFLPSDTIQRMFINSYVDGSNLLRLSNWQIALKAFMQKPFFGYGITNTSIILNSLYGYNYAAHNTILTTLIHFGGLGSIPFAVIIIKIIFLTIEKEMRILFGITISLLTTSLMIEANVTITFWVVLILLYQISSFKKNNPEVQLEKVI